MKSKILFLTLLCTFFSICAQQKITVKGYIYDRVTTKDLPNVNITILNPDSTIAVETEAVQDVVETILGQYKTFQIGYYEFEIPVDSLPYTMRLSKNGYDTLEQKLDLSKIGSRQFELKLPPIYMTPEVTGPTVELEELVVKTSKIKFYHKGDTIVYNADAFMLPQGSTLDALIAQLAGVEIKEGGKIYVNGKYVESLLLNGKDFFKGNQDVLRQNIGAYTVKDIAVYDKYGQLSKLMDTQLDNDKEYVMDVRLKKDYMGGYLGNIEASYGTDDRYSGKIFAMHFNNNGRYTLYGNINNVNNTNKPTDGQGNQGWGDQSPSGISDIANGGFDYQVVDPMKVWQINRNVDVKYVNKKLDKNIFTESFLQRNSYQTTFDNSRDKTFTLFTTHTLRMDKERYYINFRPEFRYNRSRSMSGQSSVEFDSDMQERYDVNQKVIDALYSGTSQELREAIINRNRYNRTHRSNNYRGYFWSEQGFRFKNSPDAISIWIEGEYNRDHTRSLTDQTIDYGFNGNEAPVSSNAYRRENKKYPDYTAWIKGAARYFIKSRNATYSIGYEYRHEEQRRSSLQFLYESYVEDGEANLPTNADLLPDFGNTNSSKQNFNIHMIKGDLDYNTELSPNLKLSVKFSPEFHINTRDLNYNAFEIRDSEYYPITIPIRRTSCSFNKSGLRVLLFKPDWKYQLTISYNFGTLYAPLTDMIDIPNSSDPMNIYHGNPNLKDALNQYVGLQYMWSPAKNTTIFMTGRFEYTSRDLVKGYIFNSKTGVRDFQTVNVSGNINSELVLYFIKSFNFENHEISMQVNGRYGYDRYANMIGEDGPMRKQVVNSDVFGYFAYMQYTFSGKYSLGGQFIARNIFSRSNSAILANTVERQYTPRAWINLKLPFGLSFNTSMNYIIIKGIDNRGMNPNHCLLNAYLRYQLNDNWSFKVEGYDILNQQKPYTNVISAAGRTQTIVNALPRYVMLTVGYKFNTKKK